MAAAFGQSALAGRMTDARTAGLLASPDREVQFDGSASNMQLPGFASAAFLERLKVSFGFRIAL